MSKTYQRFLEEVDMYTPSDIAEQVWDITEQMSRHEAFEFYKELESRLDTDLEKIEVAIRDEEHRDE